MCQNVGGFLCVQCTLTYLLSSSSREFFLGWYFFDKFLTKTKTKHSEISYGMFPKKKKKKSAAGQCPTSHWPYWPAKGSSTSPFNPTECFLPLLLCPLSSCQVMNHCPPGVCMQKRSPVTKHASLTQPLLLFWLLLHVGGTTLVQCEEEQKAK